METIQFKTGQTVIVNIKRLGINGEGVGYVKRKVVFVPGALPGETVRAIIREVYDNYSVAELEKVLTPAKERTKPLCPVYDACGGCQLQHMTYEGQLKAKREIVVEAFRKYVKKGNVEIRDVVGMENPWAYRNKAQLQVGIWQGRVITGLYAPGSHRLVELSDCMVQHPKTNEIIQAARQVLEMLHIPIYDERKRTGVVRTIVARVGFASGQSQLVFVTATKEIPRVRELVLELRYRLPELTSIIQNINPKKTSLIFGDETRVLWGEERIAETLGDVQFSLSPRAFFQLNPKQTVKLYNFVREAAALTGKELLIDAYCGVGTIGLWLAPFCREVRGIEEIPEAVEDARRNAELSGIQNAAFYVGRAEKLLPQWVRQGLKPDVIVVDPPRVGLAATLIDTLIAVKPNRLVYVSCNPSTLAKDCARLLSGGFSINYVQPVDMFPHTSHVECVILMVRKGA
jgi:23S rRNA (uracil-5-)-methyltransferase RumA